MTPSLEGREPSQGQRGPEPPLSREEMDRLKKKIGLPTLEAKPSVKPPSAETAEEREFRPPVLPQHLELEKFDAAAAEEREAARRREESGEHAAQAAFERTVTPAKTRTPVDQVQREVGEAFGAAGAEQQRDIFAGIEPAPRAKEGAGVFDLKTGKRIDEELPDDEEQVA